jgi:hypothetical protein
VSALLEQLEAAAAEGLAPNLRRFLAFLGWTEGEVFELQVLKAPRDTRDGRWKDGMNMAAHGATLAVIERLAAQGDAFKAIGVYAIFNRIKPAVQHRRGPDAWHVVPDKEGTKNADITHRRVLYFDLDPEREDGVKNISTTGVELQAAVERAERARVILTSIIPGESIGGGLSGNGCALFVALEPMPPEGEPDRLVKAALVALAGLLDDDVVKVDTSVSEAKRLCFLPGTVKRKGAHHPDRPHRRTAFLGSEAPRRLALDELRGLVMALREMLPEDRRADVDKELAGPPSKGAPRTAPAPRPAPRSAPQRGSSAPSPGEGVCDVVNRNVPVQDVLSRLGLLDGDRPTCPGCREADSGVAIVGNGLKCSHNRCAHKGHSKGFRTVVDLIMEVEGVDPRGALAWVRAVFPEVLPEPPARRASPPAPLAFPPVEEVMALWTRTEPLERLADATEEGPVEPLPDTMRDALLRHEIDLGGVDLFSLAGIIPADAPLPSWAVDDVGKSWIETGHRLLVPLVDLEGEVRSLRAVCPETGRALSPSGHHTRGLVLADHTARQLLNRQPPQRRALDVVITSRVLDFLALASSVSDANEAPPAMLGVLGSTNLRTLSQCIPPRSRVVLQIGRSEQEDRLALALRRELLSRGDLDVYDAHERGSCNAA